MDLNAVSERSSSDRGIRVFLALIALPAILIGVLLMHAFISDGAGFSAAETSAVSTSSVSDSGVAVVDCGEPCLPTHSIIELACAFALFVALILLALPALITSWRTRLAFVVRTLFETASARLAAPELHALSISRT